MSRQSDATRLLAIGLLNLADDEGYFYADPKTVRNHLRQMDDDSLITHGALTELSQIGYISITEHATHGPVGKVIAFLDHQVINRPTASKIKALYDSGSAHGEFSERSRPEGKGKEGNGTGKGIPPISPKGDSVKRFEKPTIDDVDAYGQTMTPPFTRALQFVAHYESNGWKVGRNAMKDWRAAVRTWQAKDGEFSNQFGQSTKPPVNTGPRTADITYV